MSISSTPPNVVIIGRTNVGKSTLFNRLVEEQKSLVSDIAGTTRDRYEADCIWKGRTIRLIDTGGLDVNRKNEIEDHISTQAERAIKKADVIIFVTDVTTGPLPKDLELARRLVKVKTPIIVVANKADNREKMRDFDFLAWKSWPLAQPLLISANRGTGTGDLLDRVFEELEKKGITAPDSELVKEIRVAVIGRPNVGKSTLLNSLLGEERYIASPIEHTTREPNDTVVTVDGTKYRLIDTAGMRKKAKIRGGDKLEQSGVEKTVRIMNGAHVVLFVLDISQEIHVQDKYLAGKLAEAETSVIIIANKWDVIPDKDSNTVNKYEAYIRAHLPMLDYAPIVFTSALNKLRTSQLYELVDDINASRFTELSENQLSKFIKQAIVRHKPSRGRGVAHPRIAYFHQTGINPPRFELGIRQQRADALAESYLRFLENLLRERFDFEGTPIRIHVKARKKSHTT